MSLKFTASDQSRIRKPGSVTKSPLSSSRKAKKESVVKKEKEPLEVLQQNVPMNILMSDADSVLSGVDSILNNQWAELTMYHERHFSRESKESCANTDDLLFLLRGISMENKADILKYRAQQLPRGGLVTLSQLYSLFDLRGNTFVDQSLELCVRQGKLRKFIISNALPVILRPAMKTTASILSLKITYGYENTEVVARTQNYLDQISADCDGACGDPNRKEYGEALVRFKEYVQTHPASLFVTNETFSIIELKVLVEAGYLTLTSNHHNEIDVHQYSIAFPKCGTFLKMINSGRVWLVQTLTKAAFKELLEDALFEKWEGKKMSNFRRTLYGYDLLWILADAKGGGVIEAFKTPVGRAWKLTGKL
ncbi:hypothetical protein METBISCDRAFT_21177 [Metschnikowia bicuspidata]|uniref:Uncharacterized protein n=1 Tax=Metschnikowia bicuspidata TaxID=27322 RepID=A0A4P9ZI93_9ASCO|nr:hypothetical protein METBISCDRAFT_21177 [Metschnikowia bicuspidata]